MSSPEFPSFKNNPRASEGEKREKIETSGDALPTPEGETWTREVVVSNRLPITVKFDDERNPTVVASSGGLVTAMSPLLSQGVRGKWIGWSGNKEIESASENLDEERGLEEALRTKPEGQYDVGVVSLTADEVRGFYDGFCNGVLAPLFVGQVDKVDYARIESDWPIYRAVQKKYAEKICSDLQSGDIIWVQNYQLAGVGTELNAMGVKQPLGFFLHEPFPSPEDYEKLPSPQRETLLRDFLSYDIVGFQTSVFKQRFIDVMQRFVPEAQVESTQDPLTILRVGERKVRLGNFPISIDPQEFEEQLRSPATQRNIRRLEKVLKEGKSVEFIFNVGRLDYTKGFYEELLAFDRLLEKHPELVGKIILYELVVPSREAVPAYREYKEQIVGLAKSINEKYGAKIVRQVHGKQGRERLLAHYGVADIQDFSSKADGMGLIPKEAGITGKPTMVQIIGQEAGAAEELGDYAILIDPANTESYADALYRAHTMADSEKRERKQGMSDFIKANDVSNWWFQHQEPLFQEVWDEKRAR